MKDYMPLAGKRIAITRARHQAGPLGALIEAAGGMAVAYPCIAIELPADTDALDAALGRLGNMEWLALSSGNAAWAVAQRARDLGVKSEIGRVKIAALGPATSAEVVRQLGRTADFVPASYNAESLARELPLEPGDGVLLPQSDLAEAKAAEILRERGAAVSAVVAYHTVVGQGGTDLPAMIARGEIDALSFASPSAVRYFRRRCPAAAALRLPALCLGPATANAARQQGFHDVIQPASINLREMAAALGLYFAARAGKT